MIMREETRTQIKWYDHERRDKDAKIRTLLNVAFSENACHVKENGCHVKENACHVKENALSC